jgi:hypothetical protein
VLACGKHNSLLSMCMYQHRENFVLLHALLQ